LVQGVAKRNAQIFDQVMTVNFHITRGANLQIEATVLRPLFEHVLPERRTGTVRQLDVELTVPSRFSDNSICVSLCCA
jgi:hypothetical protein